MIARDDLFLWHNHSLRSIALFPLVADESPLEVHSIYQPIIRERSNNGSTPSALNTLMSS